MHETKRTTTSTIRAQRLSVSVSEFVENGGVLSTWELLVYSSMSTGPRLRRCVCLRSYLGVIWFPLRPAIFIWKRCDIRVCQIFSESSSSFEETAQSSRYLCTYGVSGLRGTAEITGTIYVDSSPARVFMFGRNSLKIFFGASVFGTCVDCFG